VTPIIRLILEVVIGKAIELISGFIAKMKRHKKIDEESKEDIDQLKNAESLDEREKAVKDLADNF
jgi:hypothetical protein